MPLTLWLADTLPEKSVFKKYYDCANNKHQLHNQKRCTFFRKKKTDEERKKIHKQQIPKQCFPIIECLVVFP